MPDLEAWVIAICALGMALGGLVKGTIGMGLPMVAVAVMSTFLPVPLVLGIVSIPIVLTNVWQAFYAGLPLSPLRRFWPTILTLLVGIWFGAGLVAIIDPKQLFAVIGVTVVVFSAFNLFRPTGALPPRAAVWLGPIAGGASGILGGLSTIWGPPILMYFLALRLKKEDLVQTMGLVWTCGSPPLLVAYVHHGILTAETAPIAAYACVPAFLGLWLGQWLRRVIDEELFRKVILSFLILVGLNLIRRALF